MTSGTDDNETEQEKLGAMADAQCEKENWRRTVTLEDHLDGVVKVELDAGCCW